jgi:hypothetical protein
LREHRTEIEDLDARLVVVGTGAGFQARRLMDQGLPFECLVDPEARLYRALGIGRVSWRAALLPATYLNYWRGWRRGGRQHEVTGDPRRLSGVAVFDAGQRLRWRYVARTIGDYPPVTSLLTALRNAALPAGDGR